MAKKTTKKHEEIDETTSEVGVAEKMPEPDLEAQVEKPVEPPAEPKVKHEPPLDARLELLLDPKAGPRFEKVLTRQEFEKVQAKAKQFLQEKKDARGVVRGHWQNIIDGKVPFGFEVIG